MKKAALITGGGIRVGRSIAIRLAEEGYDIALHYNNSSEEAENTANIIRKIGVNCETFVCNFSNISPSYPISDKSIPQEEGGLIKALTNSVFKKFKNLNLLVNNASIFERHSLIDTTIEAFDNHININFKAPFFLTQHFAQNLRINNNNGQVINILDTCITDNQSPYFIYLLSKKILADFTKMSAYELSPDIRVNAICPGSMLPSEEWNQDKINTKALKLPLEATMTIKDLTDTMLYLINSHSITGECIFVDSGQHL